MLLGKTVVVVMPAYNAARTLEKTWRGVVAYDVVDLVVVVDDGSCDATFALARTLNKVVAHAHPQNLGYGANQKTCYRLALEHGADIVVMVHPDYQYSPKLIPAMAALVASGLYSCVLGSRILGGQALPGGMPLWRYVANRCLTLIQNLLFGTKVSDFHTGYRAFSRELLERLPLAVNSDDFVFDSQILAQTLWCGFHIGEISCPTSYTPEASSITFPRSVRYGLGCLSTAALFRLAKWRLVSADRFSRPETDTAGRDEAVDATASRKQ